MAGDIFNKFMEGAKMVAEKSEELVEVAKLKYSISKIETEIVKRKTELGDLVYKLYKEGEMENPGFKPLCEEIDKLHSEIEILSAQSGGYQGDKDGKACPKCQFVNPPGAKYCVECGRQV
jgi:hypothetical protein